jgi:hypothetical protein
METVETAGESWCVSFVWTSGVGKVNELASLLVAGGMLRFDPVLSCAHPFQGECVERVSAHFGRALRS